MAERSRPSLKTLAVPLLLVLAVGVALIWEIAARFSSRPFDPFTLSAASFAGFEPGIPGWSVSPIPLPANNPVEPNILAFEARRGSRTAVIRLVHGYNMPMCMKIKGYTVEELGEGGGNRLRPARRSLGEGGTAADGLPAEAAAKEGPRTTMPYQAWRLTSSVGERSCWLTTMLRAGDCEPTADDVTSLPFPRVWTPDDPRWKPEGLTWASLRHPIREIRTRLRARWNSSRTDLLTFLRLRRPAWASEELLTLVSFSSTLIEGAETEEDWIRDLVELQSNFTESLRTWRQAAQEGTALDPAAGRK